MGVKRFPTTTLPARPCPAPSHRTGAPPDEKSMTPPLSVVGDPSFQPRKNPGPTASEPACASKSKDREEVWLTVRVAPIPVISIRPSLDCLKMSGVTSRPGSEKVPLRSDQEV